MRGVRWGHLLRGVIAEAFQRRRWNGQGASKEEKGAAEVRRGTMPETGPKRGRSLARSSPWKGARDLGREWCCAMDLTGRRDPAAPLTWSLSKTFGLSPRSQDKQLEGSKQVTDSKCGALCPPHSGCSVEAAGGQGESDHRDPGGRKEMGEAGEARPWLCFGRS